MKKNIIITIDFGASPEWSIKAKSKQISAWVEANKDLLPFDDMILIPAPGETKLYWLEGDIENKEHLKTLDNIKDKLKPVLEAALGISVPDKVFIDPYKKEIEMLRKIRQNKNNGPESKS